MYACVGHHGEPPPLPTPPHRAVPYPLLGENTLVLSDVLCVAPNSDGVPCLICRSAGWLAVHFTAFWPSQAIASAVCAWSRLGASACNAAGHGHCPQWQYPCLPDGACLLCLQGCRHGALRALGACPLTAACWLSAACSGRVLRNTAAIRLRSSCSHALHLCLSLLQYPNQMLEITVRMYLYRWISRGEPGAIGAEYMQHNLQVGGGGGGAGVGWGGKGRGRRLRRPFRLSPARRPLLLYVSGRLTRPSIC